MSGKEIFSGALKLPKKSRAQLAAKLLESLEDFERVDQKIVDAAWAEEAEARIDAMESGKVKTISLSKVVKRLKKKLRQ